MKACISRELATMADVVSVRRSSPLTLASPSPALSAPATFRHRGSRAERTISITPTRRQSTARHRTSSAAESCSARSHRGGARPRSSGAESMLDAAPERAPTSHRPRTDQAACRPGGSEHRLGRVPVATMAQRSECRGQARPGVLCRRLHLVPLGEGGVGLRRVVVPAVVGRRRDLSRLPSGSWK